MMTPELFRHPFDRLTPAPAERDVRRITAERKSHAESLKAQMIPLGDTLSFVDNDYSALERLYREKTGTEFLGDPFTAAEHPIPLTKSCSVVIPVYNPDSPLESTLRSIAASTFNAKYPGKLEVILADDASPRIDTAKLVESWGIRDLNITVVRNRTNGRENKARYAGLLAAKGDIVIFGTQDIAYSPTLIEEYMKRHEILPDIALFAFRDRIRPDDGRIAPEAISHGSLAELPYAFRDDGRTKAMADTRGFRESGFGRQVPLDVLDAKYRWNLPSMGWGISVSAPRETLLKTKVSYDPRFLGFGGDDEQLIADLIAEGLYIAPVTSGIVHHIEHPSRWDPKDAAVNATILRDNYAHPPVRQDPHHPEPVDSSVTYRQTNPRRMAMQGPPTPQGDGYDRALALYRTGQAESAVEAFKTAKNAHAGDGWFWHDYGLALSRSGRAQEAVAALERSRSYIPGNTWIESSLGAAYGRAGLFRQSLDAYRRALSLDPENAEARIVAHDGPARDHEDHLDGIARHLAARGAYEEALRYFAAAHAVATER